MGGGFQKAMDVGGWMGGSWGCSKVTGSNGGRGGRVSGMLDGCRCEGRTLVGMGVWAWVRQWVELW